MRVFVWIGQMMRVDTVDFLATLFLALVLHYSSIIWNPMRHHSPDLSSGLYICAVLLLLMRPWNRPMGNDRHISSFWRSIWPNSIKMTIALMLLQHVGLLRLWDNGAWLLNCTQQRLAGNCRMLLAVILLGYAIYRWWRRLKADAADRVIDDADNETTTDISLDASADVSPTVSTTSIAVRSRCPYCSARTKARTLAGELGAPKMLKVDPHRLDSYESQEASFEEQSMIGVNP